jgi:hypothetical protein
LGGGGARGRSELTGRDPPTRHCGSNREGGERERRKEGPGRRTQARAGGCGKGAVAAEIGEGGGVNVSRQSPPPPRQRPEGSREGIGKARESPIPVLEARPDSRPTRRGRSLGQAELDPENSYCLRG